MSELTRLIPKCPCTDGTSHRMLHGQRSENNTRSSYTMSHMFFLQAYHRGIHYPRHVLLTLGWYRQNWWRDEDSTANLSCTAEQRESVLNISLAFLQCDFLGDEDLNMTTETGIVSHPPGWYWVELVSRGPEFYLHCTGGKVC